MIFIKVQRIAVHPPVLVQVLRVRHLRRAQVRRHRQVVVTIDATNELHPIEVAVVLCEAAVFFILSHLSFKYFC